MSPFARLKALLTGDSLRGRALASAGLTALRIGANQPLRLIGNLILTRLLMPEAFGLMALVTVIHGALDMATDVGLAQSVIRSEKGSDPHYLRVVWTVKILRNLGIMGIVLLLALGLHLLAPVLEGSQSVYADPQLPPVLAASSVLLLLGGLTAPSVLLAKRDLRMGRVIGYQLLSQVIGIVVTTVMCFVFRNVWGLVIGGIIQSLVWLVITHILIPGPRMALAWDREQTREMWKFGRWVMFSSIGEYLAASGDRLVMAALLTPQSFGLYAVAYLWVQAGQQVLTQIGGTVYLPVFSEIRRRNAARLTGVLRRGFALFMLLSAVVFAGCLAIGFYAIEILYVGAFATVGPLVMALAFKIPFMAVRPLGSIVLSEGDSRHVGLSQIFRGLSVVLATFLGFELFGAAGAVLLQVVAVAPALLMMASHPAVSTRLPRWLTGGVIAAIVLATLAYFALRGFDDVAAVLG
jgi:O-antigen/teichoic acid export membrane protein